MKGADGVHDGSITFSTALDNAQLEKDLARLTKKIQKKEQEVADLRVKRDEGREKSLFDAAALDAEKAKLQEIEDRMADIRAMAKDKSLSPQARDEAKALLPSVQEELSGQKARVNALQSEWNKLENSIDRYDKSLEGAEAALDRQKEEAGYLQRQIDEADQARADALASAEVADRHIVELNRELLELKARQQELEQAGVGLGYQEYDRNAARIAEVTKELKGYQKALSETSTENIKAPIDRASLAAERMNSVLAKSKDLLGTAVSMASKALKTVGGAILGTAKKAALLAAHLNVFSKLSDSLHGKFKRLGRTIKSALVFSVIYKGLSLVRDQMGAYLTVNTEFSNALRRLRGILLTAFQPIYEVVVPALTAMINVLARAIAVVSQFFAALFGKMASQAQANAKDLYEQANATKAAGGAAEEASKQIASFDEINQLQGSKSAGGGGSVEVDNGPLFDWEYEDAPFNSWGEAFNAFLDKLLGGIPKLEASLDAFAHWLNGFTEKLYDMFTFPGVSGKVEQLGRDLANAFNGLVSKINWYQLGQAMGAGLDLALQFLTESIYAFEWVALGASLAAMIDGLVAEIDWYDFGRLLWAGFKIGLETLAGFLLGLDMPELAQAASNVVLGFFDEMKDTIDRIPWDDIGRQIVSFFASIDWSGIFQAVYDAFSAALDALSGSIIGGLNGLGDQLDMSGITDPLVELVQGVHDFIKAIVSDTRDWISSLDMEPLSGAFQRLLEAISPLVSTISDGLLWAYENVLLPLASWTIEEAAPTLLSALAQALDFLRIVLEKLQPVAQFIWNDILQPVAGFAWDVISGALEAITNTLQKLTDLLAGNTTFSDFIDSLAPGEAVILGIAAAIGVMGAAFAVSSAISVAGGLIAAAVTAIGVALEFLMSPVGVIIAVVAALAAGFTLLYQHVEPFREFVDGIIEWAGNLIPGIVEGIESAWDGFMEWWDGLWTGVVEAFKDFFGIHSPSTLFSEFGVNLIAGLLNGLSDKWLDITNFFVDKVKELSESFSEAWKNITDMASKAWDNIKTSWKSAGEWFNKTVVEPAKKFFTDLWDTAKKLASDAWDGVQSVWSVVADWFNDTVICPISDLFGNMRDTIREIADAAWGAVTKIWGAASEWFKTNVTQPLLDALNGVIEFLTGVFTADIEKVFSGIRSIVDSAISFVSGLIKGFIDLVGGAISALLEFIGLSSKASSVDPPSGSSDSSVGGGRMSTRAMPDISTLNIPALAQGAVIPPNREFLAVLGDQKSGTNIETPLSTMVQAFKQAMREGGHGGDRPITVILQVDRRELGRLVYEVNSEETQRVGVRLTEAKR